MKSGPDLRQYLRQESMPNVWCPGCGHGSVMAALTRAFDNLQLDLDQTVVVGGIGCASRMPFFLNTNGMHTTHGRALAFATGVKLASPDLNVITVMGDGDALSIGGNHLIHACRRNIDLTALILNNGIYGMTGGQLAPTTITGAYTSTSPAGNHERPFDAAKLVEAAGATFVARAQSYRTQVFEDIFARALDHKGFSFVEVMTDCTEYFGRTNRLGNGADLLFSQARAEQAIETDLAERPTLTPVPPKAVRPVMEMGVLHESRRPTLEEAMGLTGEQR